MSPVAFVLTPSVGRDDRVHVLLVRSPYARHARLCDGRSVLLRPPNPSASKRLACGRCKLLAESPGAGPVDWPGGSK